MFGINYRLNKNLLIFALSMKTVLITGDSGMLGKYITKMLYKQDYRVHWWSRKGISVSDKKIKIFHWDVICQQIDINAFEDLNLSSQ